MSALLFTQTFLAQPVATEFAQPFINLLAQDPDPGRVATIRWFGIAIVILGLSVIFLRWWRRR
ncbi:hypothetical protein VR010_07875 [Actinomycetaceae bacterium L2_0104]